MRRGGIRRLLAALAAVTTMAALVAATPVAADGTGRPVERQEAMFDLAGDLCPDAGAPDDGSITFTGRTEATIDLASGRLTLVLPTNPAGGVGGRGSWELQPDTSTGSLSGQVTIDRRGRATVFGRGSDALAGTRVLARLELTETDANCAEGFALAGAGKARRPVPAAPVGAVQVAGVKPVDVAVADLTAAINANPNLTLVRTVDHQAAAASRGLALGPTVELFFGNPNLGTPLMQTSQSTGIDLPQKMLVWEDLLGTTRVAYNAPAYLQSRHGIVGADAQLGVITNALAGLASVAAGVEVTPTFDAGQVPNGIGLVSIESTRSPEEAYAAIVAALEAAPPVNVAITLEHDANAASVGLELEPTKLVVFGNPSLGTGLMQTQRSIALDLPQKILVSQTGDGPTVISWNDPFLAAKRHGVTGQDATLTMLAGALANFGAQGQ